MADQRSLAAAQAALEAGRWDEARSMFESLLKTHETAEVRLGLAEAWWWLGDPRRTVEHFERGYVLSRRAGDLDRAVWAALWLALTYGSDFGNPAAFSGWLGRAERALRESGSRELEGWLKLVKAYDTSHLPRSQNLAERVLERARESGDFDLELCAMALLGEILVATARVDEGLALIDEAMAGTFGGERNQFLTVVFTCCSMISACELAADTKRATHWCRMAEGFVQKYGCPFLHATCRAGYGDVLATTGHWAEAEEALNSAVKLAEGYPPLRCNALARLAELRVNQGRLEEAEQLLSDMADHAAGTITAARLRIARGQPTVAVALLTRYLKHESDSLLKRSLVLELLAEAHLMAGERDAAAAAASDLEALAARHDRPIIVARAARAEARVVVAAGASSSAIGLLETALIRFSAADLPFETARTRVELARLLLDRQPEVAIAEARSALAAFEHLGASRDADTAGALLRSLGVAGRTGPKNVGVLTRREQQVLRLISQGLTNPEIAERLFISRKTASHHVSNVLSKLGLRTRTEAAAYATRADHKAIQ